jgi:uncharacterized protein YbdZ (MbtH family)
MRTLLDDDEDDEDAIYKVVITPSGYYAVMPGRKATPEGWWDAGFFGTKQECFEWTRKTPLPV